MGDPRPDLKASLDQLQATLADVAPVLAQYRAALELCGFERAEAMELVVEVQHLILVGEDAE